MMRQLQKLQEQLEVAQAKLAEETVTASAGGGAVTITVTGDQQCRAVQIDAALLEEGDVEMLQDLLLAAFNSALEKSRQLAAERLGKEAALFVPSGTMANLVSQMVHCGRGDEMIVGHLAHSFYYEQGGSAAVACIHPRTVLNQPDGKFQIEELQAAIRGDNIHFPRTRLISIENTHNLCGGSPLDPAYIGSVGEIARRHGIKLHIDGARLFNAAVALGVPVKDLALEADSVSFCLSKGLAAPVGSVVCGGPRPQSSGRGNAPGRRISRSRYRGHQRNGGQAGRRPRQRPATRPRVGGDCRS